jgi:hypothetical protein
VGSARKAAREAIDFRMPRLPFLPKAIGKSSSCQDLAQTTHHYAITKQCRKPALEQAC